MQNNFEKAFRWIVGILMDKEIPFQIKGGFAAHIYGSSRPINDIDIDIPENKMELIFNDIKEFITFGPGRYKDERWDLDLITLTYHNQEIDIGGAYTTKIFDDTQKIWKDFPENLEKTEIHDIYGIKVPVIDPANLIKYKKLLSGDHQKVDIKAVQKYLKRDV